MMQTPHDSATYWPSDKEFISCARILPQAIWLYACVAMPAYAMMFLDACPTVCCFIDDFGNLVRYQQ